MGMDTNKGLLEHNGKQYAKKRDVNPEEIEWNTIIDKELTDEENWKRIDEKVKDLMDEEQLENEYIKNIEEENHFKEGGHKEVQSFYDTFNYRIKAIANDFHQALMVNAEAGIGKSYQTDKVLKDELGEEKFKKSPAVSAPFQFYKQLWELEQNDEQEILVLDDIEGLLRSKKALAILKQATWSETENRFVGWNSSPSKLKNKDGEDIPKKFQFTGRLIMIFNEVPKDDAIFKSLKDRCFYHELSFTYEQKSKLIQSIAHKGMGYDIENHQRKEIASWLRDVTTPATDELNLRTFELAIKHFLATQDLDTGVTWKEAVKESLEVDKKLEEARDIITDRSYTTPKERQKEFVKRTGKTARTYRTARNELEENSDKIKGILQAQK